VSVASPRSSRYVRARAPPAAASCARKNAAATALTATSGSRVPLAPATDSGIAMPKRCATQRTASGKASAWVFMTKPKTSPCSPQPKQ
jgi:hypothetical protein